MSETHEDDRVVGDGLRDLPRPPLDPAAAARIHARARAAFAAAAAAPAAARAAPRGWWALWNRALEPALVAGVVIGYFAWTAATLGTLDRTMIGAWSQSGPPSARSTLPWRAR
jgi:hypothetical protein